MEKYLYQDKHNRGKITLINTKNTPKQIVIFTFLIIIMCFLASGVVVTGGSSSYSFSVENCTATPSADLTCDPATIRYECDFGNYAFIDFVEFRIAGTNHVATQNATKPQQFYYYYNKPQDTSSSNSPLLFDRQTITDVDAHSVNANVLVSLNHSCDTCEATFTETPIDFCQANNTQLYRFTSSNTSCQPTYEAEQTCDFCQPYLVSNTTACGIDNTQTTTYNDLNFNSCCQVTNATEDCPTLYYPYNQASVETCQFVPQSFDCNLDETPVLNDKMNVNCVLSDKEPSSCILNIYQGQSLLQTSPEFKQKTQGSLIPTELETRESFATQNGVLNAYYTKKELRPDTNYTLTITCSTEENTYENTYTINPQYHTPDEPTQRAVWAKNNIGFILIGAFMFVLLAIFIGYLVRKARGGK